MSRKYDPVYHSNVPRNFRAAWKEHGQKMELTLTDEEIWNILCEWGTCELPEGEGWPNEDNRYDAMVLQVMLEREQEKLSNE